MNGKLFGAFADQQIRAVAPYYVTPGMGSKATTGRHKAFPFNTTGVTLVQILVELCLVSDQLFFLLLYCTIGLLILFLLAFVAFGLHLDDVESSKSADVA